jgi:hypothetical protein
VTRVLVAPPGTLESVDVPDVLADVVRVRVYREPGYVVAPLRRGSDRAGALLAVGATRDEAVANADRAAAAIRVRVGVPSALVG